jgi:uncharacterized phage protein gp47/JayE
MAGLDENGFTVETEDEIKESMQDDLDSKFGSSNASRLTVSVLGILIAIMALMLSRLWQLALLVYNSQSPSGAFGVLLDRVLELTGVTRLARAKSTVYAVCVGTNLTVLAVGRRIKNAVTLTYWASTEAKTIATLSAWGASTEYEERDLVTNDSGKIYYCVTEGTSAGSGGPTGTGSAITDGTVVWKYVAAGTAAVVVPFESEDYGQIVGAAGDLSSIETPQSGWTSVTNPEDAEQGRDTESDAAARIRRIELLASTGDATLDAIQADIAALDDVERVIVFKNDTDEEDADGVPGGSVEVLVKGGDDDEIFAALFATVAAGIRTHGTESTTVTDSNGNEHTVKFSRPTDVNIYYVVDVVIDADDFPTDGDAQIKQALVDFAEGLPVGGFTFPYGRLDIGDDVIPDQQRTAPKQVAGVTYVNAFKLGTAPAPAGTATIAITNRQIADIDTSRITVNHV